MCFIVANHKVATFTSQLQTFTYCMWVSWGFSVTLEAILFLQRVKPSGLFSTVYSPIAIIGDWSICLGPGWLLGLMGALLGPTLPCMGVCCPGPGAEPPQPSCCCSPGRGPPGAMSPTRTNTDVQQWAMLQATRQPGNRRQQESMWWRCCKYVIECSSRIWTEGFLFF